MVLYTTAAKKAQAVQIIEKSRFIAHVCPVESREEADAFFAAIRKEYRDATHNVPALVLGDKMQIQWASDDGEPQGTSGAPIVQMLAGRGITNTAVMVTRYFGGIKLGTGGLVRAYTSSAELGIDAAGLCDVSKLLIMEYEIDYKHLDRINSAEGKLFRITDREYAAGVTVKIAIEPSERDEGEHLFSDITSGTAVLKSVEETIVKVAHGG